MKKNGKTAEFDQR